MDTFEVFVSHHDFEVRISSDCNYPSSDRIVEAENIASLNGGKPPHCGPDFERFAAIFEKRHKEPHYPYVIHFRYVRQFIPPFLVMN